MNPDEGIYETVIYADSDPGGFLTTRGATYPWQLSDLMVLWLESLRFIQLVVSTNRVSGAAALGFGLPITTDPVGVSGMFDHYLGLVCR